MVRQLDLVREPFASHRWRAGSMLAQPASGGVGRTVINPANGAEVVGSVVDASAEDCARAAVHALGLDA